jgi:dihydrofolate reductase
MRISLVVAMSKDRVIGNENALPWHLSADLKRFKAITMGKPILMGRKTHESIGRPLPGRENIVVTRNKDYSAPGCVVVTSVEQGMTAAAGAEELMVIGGAEIYRQMLPLADRMYVTMVHGSFAGDAFFPGWEPPDWKETSREEHQADEKNPHAYTFLVFQRRRDE